MTAPRRRAFTLIELLVVTVVMASFLGLLAAGMRPSAASHVRQLSQGLSSAILAARTRALGNDTGAALIFSVPSGDVASNVILTADVPPFAVGTVSSGMPPTTLSSTSTTVNLTLENADATDLATGYEIRFFGGNSSSLPKTAWMGFLPSGGSPAGTVSLRSSAGQTINNTVWPSAPSGSSLRFEIARYPIASLPAASLPKLAAIDLRYSGIGEAMTGNYGTLSGKGSIGITFNSTGGLDSVILYDASGVAPAQPFAPLYLLIAPLADIQDDTSLQSQNSRWLVIAPGTGRVSVAANNPASGTDAAAVKTARALAREGVMAGVK
jgi:prepilin-type N-terminal cleavage/methylation domain-containing protein